MTGNAYEDLQRLRKELVYMKKIVQLQSDLINKLLAGQCTLEIMKEIADVREDIAML